ncbi:MAG: TatD DNase family protein, partial [Candidatus Krumholzibacteriia bacterium]
ERLVLETDAPNIGLAGIPAEQVEPSHIPIIAQAMADLRNVPLTTIAKATTANAQTLFNLPQTESTT